MSQVRLGLDEASLSINGTAASSLRDDSILVFYQIDECYGCPLDKLKRLDSYDQSIVLGTKHLVDLELRRTKQHQSHHNHQYHHGDGTSLVCNFSKLSLRNQGRYRIDIQEVAGNRTGFECNFQTLDDGECSYCPFAIIMLVLLLVTASEKLFARFVSSRKRRPQYESAESPRRLINPAAAATTTPPIIGGSQKQQAPLGEGGAHQAEAEQLNSGDNLPKQSVGGEPNLSNDPEREAQVRDGENSAPRGDIQVEAAANSKRPQRIDSLDAFRGVTIAGMIVVNYGGAGYKILEHQPWDGLTLADLVFPFFIFSMGASIALSAKSLMKRGKTLQQVLVKIIRRACLLMLLGLCLNSKWLDIQTQGLDELRLTGVLQRFSISYLVVAPMYAIKLSVIKWIKAQSLYRVPLVSRCVGIIFEYLTALNYLAIYLYVTFFLHYSDTCPAGYLGPGGMTENGIYANCTGGAAAWLDRMVLGTKHLYHDHEVMEVFKTKQSHDPEGLLGNTTSILLTLIGLQCGKILTRSKPSTGSHRARIVSFMKWMIALSLVSISAIFIPINKRLWSLSFVSVTAFCAFALMILLYILLDIYNCQRTFLLKLLISAGKNPIFLYVGHSLLAGMLPWQFHVDESSHLQLLLRLTWSTLCWLLVAHYMASKRLFIRV